jgi:hypothetical protein
MKRGRRNQKAKPIALEDQVGLRALQGGDR